MIKKNVVIAISDLPPRARALNPDELANVFGGCQWEWELCWSSNDCCAGMKCLFCGCHWT